MRFNNKKNYCWFLLSFFGAGSALWLTTYRSPPGMTGMELLMPILLVPMVLFSISYFFVGLVRLCKRSVELNALFFAGWILGSSVLAVPLMLYVKSFVAQMQRQEWLAEETRREVWRGYGKRLIPNIVSYVEKNPNAVSFPYHDDRAEVAGLADYLHTTENKIEFQDNHILDPWREKVLILLDRNQDGTFKFESTETSVTGENGFRRVVALYSKAAFSSSRSSGWEFQPVNPEWEKERRQELELLNKWKRYDDLLLPHIIDYVVAHPDRVSFSRRPPEGVVPYEVMKLDDRVEIAGLADYLRKRVNEIPFDHEAILDPWGAKVDVVIGYGRPERLSAGIGSWRLSSSEEYLKFTKDGYETVFALYSPKLELERTGIDSRWQWKSGVAWQLQGGFSNNPLNVDEMRARKAEAEANRQKQLNGELPFTIQFQKNIKKSK